jgi:hypothetical protein
LAVLGGSHWGLAAAARTGPRAASLLPGATTAALKPPCCEPPRAKEDCDERIIVALGCAAEKGAAIFRESNYNSVVSIRAPIFFFFFVASCRAALVVVRARGECGRSLKVFFEKVQIFKFEEL